MSVLEIYPFCFPFVYAPLALCHPPLPLMSCTAIQKLLFFLLSLLFFSSSSSSFFFLPQFHLYIPLFISTLPFLLSASPIHPLYHQPHLISIPELFYLNLSLHSFQSFCFFLLSFLVENLLRSLFLFFLLLWCICVR